MTLFDPDFNPDLGEFQAGLYDYVALAEEGIKGLAAVSAADVERFHQDGYLIIHNAFSPAEVQAALSGLLDLIDGKNPDFQGVMFERKAQDILHTLSPEKKQDVVRKLMYFVEYEPRLKAMAAHPQLLDLVSRLIGETPALLQDMALIKPPLIGREKPWHQDHAYFNLPLATPVVGIWIALDEATPENGCMHIIPGSHRQGPVVHFKRRDWQICDTHLTPNQTVAVPLEPGGCLVFHALLHHGTPPSRSGQRRRAVQFHYKPVGVALTGDEERLKIFGSEGKNVTC